MCRLRVTERSQGYNKNIPISRLILLPDLHAMSNKKLNLILLGLLGLAGVCVVAWIGVGVVFLAPQLPALFKQPIPTPACNEPKLSLGAARFRIETLARAADGSLNVPVDTPDVAYWVEGTNINYVFALSPTPNNLTMSTSLKKGDLVSIRWADCRLEEYIVKAIETGLLDTSILANQSAVGATIFVRTGSSTEGIVIKSGQPEPKVIDTPGPGESEIEAEVSFLDTTVSPDGTTFRMGISILNNGMKAFTLSTNEISLTPENAETLAPLSVEPALPREIQPGTTETFYITFPRPTTSTALFRILIFSIDIQLP